MNTRSALVAVAFGSLLLSRAPIALWLSAQSPSQAAGVGSPAFEVASVKINNSTPLSSSISGASPGRFTTEAVPLLFVILYRVSAARSSARWSTGLDVRHALRHYRHLPAGNHADQSRRARDGPESSSPTDSVSRRTSSNANFRRMRSRSHVGTESSVRGWYVRMSTARSGSPRNVRSLAPAGRAPSALRSCARPARWLPRVEDSSRAGRGRLRKLRRHWAP